MELDLDEMETDSFWGRTHSGVVYTVGDKWVFADGDRDSAQAFATLLEPVGDHGWTVLIEKRSRHEEYSWGPSVVGSGLRLTYAEAEQVAYIFHTEGEVEFDFYRGIALSLWGSVGSGKMWAKLSERYDECRSVTLTKDEGGWFATGGLEIWDDHVEWFVQKYPGVRFPEQGYVDLETARAMAFEWVIQPALADSDRASAWWLGRSTKEVLVSKVTYLHLGQAA